MTPTDACYQNLAQTQPGHPSHSASARQPAHANESAHLAAADCCGAEVEPAAALCCWRLAPEALHLERLFQTQKAHLHAFHCQIQATQHISTPFEHTERTEGPLIRAEGNEGMLTPNRPSVQKTKVSHSGVVPLTRHSQLLATLPRPSLEDHNAWDGSRSHIV